MTTVAISFHEPEAKQLLAAYGLRLHSLARIPWGTISLNFRAETDVGPVFVRISPGRQVPEAEFEAQLLWHLLSHGVRTPALFQAHNRQGHVKLPFAVGMVYEWVDGVQYTDETMDEAHAELVGQLLGQFHLCVATLRNRREGIYTPTHIDRRLRGLLRHPRATEEIRTTVERLLSESAKLRSQAKGKLPAGLGHCDLFPDNILFSRRHAEKTGSAEPWMLDLEQAAWTTFVYDLAVALFACTAPVPKPETTVEEATRCGPLRLKAARALLSGYQRMRLLSDAEWSGLYPALRTACVRFATTRLTDVELAETAPCDAHGTESAPQPADGPSAEPEKPASASENAKNFRDCLFRLDRLDEIDPATLIFALRDR